MKISGGVALVIIVVSTVLIGMCVNNVSKESEGRSAKAQRENVESMEAGKVHVGMTAAQCRTAWGQPKRINRYSDTDGDYDEWIYGGGSSLLFANGVLKIVKHSEPGARNP